MELLQKTSLSQSLMNKGNTLTRFAFAGAFLFLGGCADQCAQKIENVTHDINTLTSNPIPACGDARANLKVFTQLASIALDLQGVGVFCDSEKSPEMEHKLGQAGANFLFYNSQIESRQCSN